MIHPQKTSLQGDDALVAALETAGRAILALFPRELTDLLSRLIASRSEAEFEEPRTI